MAKNYISFNQYKDYNYYLPQKIGPGALANDHVRRCFTCKEPIAFRKRLDGSWQLLDYFTGLQHEHRQPRRGQID